MTARIERLEETMTDTPTTYPTPRPVIDALWDAFQGEWWFTDHPSVRPDFEAAITTALDGLDVVLVGRNVIDTICADALTDHPRGINGDQLDELLAALAGGGETE